MRALLFAGVLTASLGAPAALAQRTTLVDRIVAVVNKDVITFSELADRVEFASRQLRRQNIALPERALLDRQMLERLILDKAQLQLAADSGLRVDELQLDRAIQRIAENNKVTLPDLRRRLEADGVDFEKYRAEVRQQILLTRLREREVDDRVQVGDSEIDIFMEENKAATAGAGEYEAAHSLGRTPQQAVPQRSEPGRARA